MVRVPSVNARCTAEAAVPDSDGMIHRSVFCNLALPAHVMVQYVLAMAMYAEVSTQEVLRSVVEGTLIT